MRIVCFYESVDALRHVEVIHLFEAHLNFFQSSLIKLVTIDEYIEPGSITFQLLDEFRHCHNPAFLQQLGDGVVK